MNINNSKINKQAMSVFMKKAKERNLNNKHESNLEQKKKVSEDSLFKKELEKISAENNTKVPYHIGSIMLEAARKGLYEAKVPQHHITEAQIELLKEEDYRVTVEQDYVYVEWGK